METASLIEQCASLQDSSGLYLCLRDRINAACNKLHELQHQYQANEQLREQIERVVGEIEKKQAAHGYVMANLVHGGSARSKGVRVNPRT